MEFARAGTPPAEDRQPLSRSIVDAQLLVSLDRNDDLPVGPDIDLRDAREVLGGCVESQVFREANPRGVRLGVCQRAEREEQQSSYHRSDARHGVLRATNPPDGNVTGNRFQARSPRRLAEGFLDLTASQAPSPDYSAWFRQIRVDPRINNVAGVRDARSSSESRDVLQRGMARQRRE